MRACATSRSLAAAVLAASLACGGSGSSGPAVPDHQASAEAALKLAGIGDSIMQGMDVTALYQDQVGYSFAQGTSGQVSSLYSRYKLVSGLPGGEEFASVSGSTMIDDASTQATAICNQSALPNRVVILLGSNDLCNASTASDFPSVATFRAALQTALDELAGCLPPGSWVHVLSVPRIDLLYQAVQSKQESVYDVTCPAFLAAIGICTIAGDDPTALHTQVNAYNDGIQAEVVAAHDAYATAQGVEFTTDWSGTTANTSIGTFTFGADDVSSVDCFHPSAEGQRKLACAAWESWEGAGDAAACF